MSELQAYIHCVFHIFEYNNDRIVASNAAEDSIIRGAVDDCRGCHGHAGSGLDDDQILCIDHADNRIPQNAQKPVLSCELSELLPEGIT